MALNFKETLAKAVEKEHHLIQEAAIAPALLFLNESGLMDNFINRVPIQNESNVVIDILGVVGLIILASGLIGIASRARSRWNKENYNGQTSSIYDKRPRV